jgi:diacylglycerol kinase family enzyme
MLEGVNRFLFLINPASTGIPQAKSRIEELKKLLPASSVDVFELTGTDRAATSDMLVSKAAKLGPKTMLGIAAGDGTTSVIVDTLIRDKRLPAKARLSPVIPLWGGNANDLANMLNGPAPRQHMATILDHAKTIPVYPLHFDITDRNSDNSQVRIAVCNASFGATAYVAHQLNESRFRRSKLHKIPGGRLIKEASTAVTSLIKAPTFEAEDHGLKKIIYERTFSNGSRIAKLYQVPVELNDKHFYLHTIEQKRFMITALMLGASFRNKPNDDKLHRSLEFKILQDTQAQFDGETMRIAAGTEIAVRMSRRPFYAVSTELVELENQ